VPNFLYPGQSDPRQLTEGAQGPSAGHAGQLGQSKHGHGGLLQGTMATALRRGRKEGRGPLGPDSHQEYSGELGLAGGAPTAAESTAAARRSCGETAMIGGDSARLGSIPWARNKRRMRRCWGLSRRRPGRLLAAARDGGHGGSSQART
jgi:hypothetical protein